MSLEGKSVEEIEALATMAMRLGTNQKTRTGFLQLAKIDNPDTPIPEIDIPQRFRAVLEDQMKRQDALEAKLKEREMVDQIEANRRALGLSRDQLAKVEKAMVEHKIADHETAKKFLDMQDRAAEPSAPGAAFMPKKATAQILPDMKEMGGDLKQFAYKNAFAAIDELRGRRLGN